MRRAFTLIELLVVVVVLVTLMTIMFRLSSLGANADRRSRTITRMQKLENCLSGYYAAFGSYPPVKLHGKRDIYARVGNIHPGMQLDGHNSNIWSGSEDIAWNQVRAACLSQPVACNFPYPESFNEIIVAVSDEMKARLNSSDPEFARYKKYAAKLSAGFRNLGDGGTTVQDINGYDSKNDWRKVQVFRFGLMSFLLPRYLVMMNGDESILECEQWKANNKLPSDPSTGRRYSSWKQIRDKVASDVRGDSQLIASIPSQAVCARWMPNLEGICASGHDFNLFGIRIHSDDGGRGLNADNPGIELFSTDDADSSQSQYPLDGVTVLDGWDNDFYYYSPAPYQKYTLWSGGPNGYTFPPWIPRGSDRSMNERVAKWIADDIVHMSN